MQLGVGGWQVPHQGGKVWRDRATNILTVTDITEMGIDAAAEFALEKATDGTDCVWISFEIDCIDGGFVPGTGWPEPGGLLPHEALGLLSKRRPVGETRRLAADIRGADWRSFGGMSPPYRGGFYQGDGNWRSPTEHRDSWLRRSRRSIWAIAKVLAIII